MKLADVHEGPSKGLDAKFSDFTLRLIERDKKGINISKRGEKLVCYYFHVGRGWRSIEVFSMTSCCYKGGIFRRNGISIMLFFL